MPQPPAAVDELLSRKRLRKRVRALARSRKWKRIFLDREARKHELFGLKSKVIRMLAAHADQPLPASQYGIEVRLPKRFSIIDSPQEAIRLICAYALALRDGPRIEHVKFDHWRLEETDLAANAILDLVTVERKTELRRRGRTKKFSISGVYPRNKSVKNFIKAMGIIKHMAIKHEAPTKEELKRFRIFDSRNRHYRLNPDATAGDYKDKQVEKFVDFTDNCLQCINWALTDQGKHSLGLYAGEILANAEDHAEFVDWSMVGYLDIGDSTPTCEIAIFNFGKSIAETFLDLDRSSPEWGVFGKYLDLHKSNGFFGESWREEDLLTVIALQQNVSTKPKPGAARGQGTVFFMEFFQEMYEQCSTQSDRKAQMTVVSGSTYVLFDGIYRLAEPEKGRGKIIAFNEENDLMRPPSPSHVKGMNGVHFPGTIISVRFPFSVSHGAMVEELQGEKREN